MSARVLVTSASVTSIGGHFERQIFVIAQLEFGEDFEDGAEFQRLAFVVVEFFDLRLRDGGEFLFVDGFFDAFGNEGLQDFALDVVGEAAADQCERSFAGAEAGDARNFGEFFGDAFMALETSSAGISSSSSRRQGLSATAVAVSVVEFSVAFSGFVSEGVFCGVFGGAVSHTKSLSEVDGQRIFRMPDRRGTLFVNGMMRAFLTGQSG